jgi:hypothetical protein
MPKIGRQGLAARLNEVFFMDVRDDTLWQNNKQSQTGGYISTNLPPGSFPK